MKWLLLSLVMFTSAANAKNKLTLFISNDGQESKKLEVYEDEEGFVFMSKRGVYRCTVIYKKDDKRFLIPCTHDKGESFSNLLVMCSDGVERRAFLTKGDHVFQIFASCEKSKPEKLSTKKGERT